MARSRLWHILQRLLTAVLVPPALVDGAMDRHAAQPMQKVRRGFDLSQPAIQLQKDLLGYVLAQRAVMQKVPGNAENHGLVRPDQIGKGRRISEICLPERRFNLMILRRFQNVPF